MKDYPAYAVFAYQYGGLNSEGDPQVKLSDGTFSAEPYATKAEDIKYMGTAQPVWTGGLSNSISYNHFQLMINVSYNLGNVMRKSVNSFYTGLLYDNINAEFLNRWQKPGDEAHTDIPRYIGPSSSMYSRQTYYYINGDNNVFDAGYMKVRDISLSYSLPDKILNLLKLKAITLRAQISNIMLWKANDFDIDPEFLTIDGARILPVGQHSITLGAHVSF